MSICHLIRHGSNSTVGRSVAGWSPGVHLDEVGIAQAERLTERFVDADLAAVYSSPLERAIETAAPLAARLGVRLSIREALAEIRYGEWTGRTLEELDRDPRWRLYNTRRGHTRIPGGETMLEVQARIVSEIERLALRHVDQSFAVVSHGDVIRLAIAYVIGCGLDAILRFDVDLASVSSIEIADDGYRVLALNDRAALPDRVPAVARGRG